jgi:FAD-linked oxidoreductase
MKIVGGKWSNWSGSVVCKPRAIVAPKTELELAGAVRTADGPVRTPGTGHSFTPLNETNGTMIDLAAFTGLRGFDPDKEVATFGAATPLWDLGPLIHPLGYGLRNMGDIDRQTLGGVVGTGTHGTGITLGSFSAEVAGFRLVLASGEVINCADDENPDIFAAGRTSLGALGVMTEISIQVRPAYKLVEQNFLLPADALFEKLPGLIANNRHFEFFWFPYADRCVCKTLNETADEAPDPRPAEAMRDRGERTPGDMVLFSGVNEILPYAPFLLKPAHRLFSQAMALAGGARWSHEAFPSPRTVKFNEMEYAVPFEKGADVMREIVKTIRAKKINTGYPLEFRTVAADDVWMSPFYQRKSATIALHQFHRLDTTKLFGAAEAIFRSVDGRPHWGKRHTRTGSELAHLYPQYEAFRAVRRRLDPQEKFLNGYLRKLFE